MRSVLVTGCSTGIGRACVNRLATHGWRVFAGVRDETDAESVRAEPGEVVPLHLDVTEGESIAAAVELVSERAGGRLEGLVNNAGIAIGGALETVPVEDLRRILDVNVVGQMAVTQALLPLLRSGRGRIVIVGSVGGRVAFPYAGPYHASKFALEALADSLRMELAPQGLAVSLVEPGPISTPIWSKAQTQVETLRASLEGEARQLYTEEMASFEQRLRSADEHGENPEKVAAVIAAALEGSASARYPVGRGVRTLINLRPLLPDFVFDRLARRVGGQLS
jgi:NAD(P)-dependent dehydrogenase (short-subunit alcohol dehydrogenase family)